MPAVTAEVTSIALVVLFDNAARMLLTSTVEVAAVELDKRELRVELVLIGATYSLGRRHRVHAKLWSLHRRVGVLVTSQSTPE
jgi:hypothetical protein